MLYERTLVLRYNLPMLAVTVSVFLKCDLNLVRVVENYGDSLVKIDKRPTL
jgi:hypothetical protein